MFGSIEEMRAVQCHQNGDLRQAEALYRQILKADPANANVYHQLGRLACQIGQLKPGLALIRQAIDLNPFAGEFHFSLAHVLKSQGQIAEAVEAYRRTLQLKPQSADALVHLGDSLRLLGHLDEAAAAFDQALRYQSDHSFAHANRALLRLFRGDFENGLPEYEFRWSKDSLVNPYLAWPRWDGSILPDKTILVFAEQGLGDTIQFIRYAPLVKERVGTVVFECQPALRMHLVEGTAGVDHLGVRGSQPPAFDVQIPLLSLLGIFKTTLSTIPANVPYLRADARAITETGKHLDAEKDFKVGIAWAGNAKQQDDMFRSLPVKLFAPLAGIPGVRLVSLQVGPQTRQLADASFPVTDLGSRFDPNSLDDLAGTILNMDLVVTVDTAVAHLAGALGVPVWTLLSAAPDWRWLAERLDNPWYPTMRLFRQSRLGEWGDVFEKVAAALRGLVATSVGKSAHSEHVDK